MLQEKGIFKPGGELKGAKALRTVLKAVRLEEIHRSAIVRRKEPTAVLPTEFTRGKKEELLSDVSQRTGRAIKYLGRPRGDLWLFRGGRTCIKIRSSRGLYRKRPRGGREGVWPGSQTPSPPWQQRLSNEVGRGDDEGLYSYFPH